ncbi:MAG TPA: Gfo/Idh/MocA family oxidoreductase [Chloroflexota bacterium]|nr:Gfo/Idh/MocA family oxidoreductase [Chloroflexota bacterium]
MPPVLRLGIVGLGLASTFMIPQLARDPRLKLAAAADVRREALDVFAREFDAPTFTSVEALCASGAVDAVYVCTPAYLHAEHVITAAEHGKHVICEKPLALTVAEAEPMVAAAERNGVVLVCGHTHSFDAPIRKLARLVRGGAYGPLMMVQTWNYTDLLYRPRAPWELDTRRGGGVVYIQAPHQVEIVRAIGGGRVRSVRAMTGRWDAARPTEGCYTAYLEFEDGTPATLVYSGYGHFDSAELHYWVGERGQMRDPATHAETRRAYQARAGGAADEAASREAIRFGGARDRREALAADAAAGRHQPFFGLTLVSCQRADLRQSPDGLYVYGDDGQQELDLAGEPSEQEALIAEFYAAVVEGERPWHDGRWGLATLEVCTAILQSARERREILLAHQTATPF